MASPKLIDSLERFSEDNMRCSICLDDLRVQRGFLELPCCNGGKLCFGCTYEYITKRKERRAPCCRTDISDIQKWITVVNTAQILNDSYSMWLYEPYLTPAEIERREHLKLELNSIIAVGRERYETAETERRAREQREYNERMARYERERQERIERERLERIRVEQERIRLEQERLARERAEEERRQMELARQLSTVQHQIETAGGISGLVSQVRQGIPFQDFYKTVRRNAPHRLQEALDSLQSQINALIRRSTPLTNVESTNLKKMQKWHFVMSKNPRQLTGLDEKLATIWDNIQVLEEYQTHPPIEYEYPAARPSSLTSDQDDKYLIHFDCDHTFTFTNKSTGMVLEPVSVNHTIDRSTGLYPIALNVVKNTNPPRGQEGNTYFAVTYGSPNRDRRLQIALYEYSVAEPLFTGHPETTDVTYVSKSEVPMSVHVNVCQFTKLLIELDTHRSVFIWA